MTKTRHGVWAEIKVVVKAAVEKPNYRGNMSAKARRALNIINYSVEDVVVQGQPIDDSHFLRTNILT